MLKNFHFIKIYKTLQKFNLNTIIKKNKLTFYIIKIYS